MHAFLLAALIITGCVNCPSSTTNTVTIGTNILANATISNGTLVVSATVPSNQLNAASAFVGTNNTPTQLIIDAK